MRISLFSLDMDLSESGDQVKGDDFCINLFVNKYFNWHHSASVGTMRVPFHVPVEDPGGFVHRKLVCCGKDLPRLGVAVHHL